MEVQVHSVLLRFSVQWSLYNRKVYILWFLSKIWRKKKKKKTQEGQ